MKTKKFTKIQNEKGFSILEILMYLTIASLLLGGVFTFVTMAKSGADLKAARQNVSSINESVYELYSAQDSYAGLSNAICESAGVFPASMVKTSGVFNVWNGAVTVAPSAGGSPTTFTIAYANVPDEEALKLATFNVGGWSAVHLNGTAISQTGGNPVSEASGAVVPGPNNTIVFTSIR